MNDSAIIENSCITKYVYIVLNKIINHLIFITSHSNIILIKTTHMKT